MKKIKLIVIVLVSLVLVILLSVLISRYFKPGSSGIIVNSVPNAGVYIDGVKVGKTPYEGINSSGQINLKLVPDTENELIPYETKINLTSGVKTVIDREFGKTEEASSGDVISFDKIGGKNAGLVVISTPDNSQVFIDDFSVGFTPYNFNTITTGSHKITIKNAGYIERTVNIKTVEGLKLTFFAKLAKGENITQDVASPSATPQSAKGFVIIKDTPTGFLRMRTEPGSIGEEIAELKPGSKYAYLDRDEKSGWYKIQYKDPAPGLPNGITGWVSNQYSSISSESGTLK